MKRNSKSNISLVIVVIAVVFSVFLLFKGYPYVIERPGPTIDTLGKIQDQYLISVKGKQRQQLQGQLRMTTVSQTGSVDSYPSGIELLLASMSEDAKIVPLSDIYPQGITADQIQKFNNLQMNSSQSNAVVAALTQLDKPVHTTLTIADVVDKSNFKGKLKQGDKIVSIARASLPEEKVLADSPRNLYDFIASVKAGTDVTIEVDRKGEILSYTAKTLKAPADSVNLGEGSVLGINLIDENKLPVQVDFAVEGIGGPSAGLMFSLAIMDIVSGDNFVKEAKIAGTGTISPNGKIGPIGGIDLKMKGSSRDGIKWFFAPVNNCDEVVGNEPEGLNVVAVKTLAQAYDATKKIADGDTKDLQSCKMYLDKTKH